MREIWQVQFISNRQPVPRSTQRQPTPVEPVPSTSAPSIAQLQNLHIKFCHSAVWHLLFPTWSTTTAPPALPQPALHALKGHPIPFLLQMIKDQYIKAKQLKERKGSRGSNSNHQRLPYMSSGIPTCASRYIKFSHALADSAVASLDGIVVDSLSVPILKKAIFLTN